MSPSASFATAERFDTLVARAFAASPATRHTRDRLIADVHSGALDAMLARSGAGLESLPVAAERRAAVNTIDFAFEALVLPGLSVAQAVAYFQAVEETLRVGEASGLDGPGPLWIDTVHHACVFSVLFQLAAHLRVHRGCDRLVLLHQGVRPEPRLGLVANLLARVHGVTLVRLPLRGRWFHDLVGAATPSTAIVYLTDIPGESAGRRASARIDLYADPGIRRGVDTVSGSAAFARRLGASHVVLDYPQADRVRLRPFDPARAPACPLVDWVFWPVLVPTRPADVTRLTA